jgi:hypothetical protein
MDTKVHATEQMDAFHTMLDGGVQTAYARQWHRIERGLRLNRLRLYIDEIAPTHNMTDAEKETVFQFLQKAHDKKLLNTLKVVEYDKDKQKIVSIKGFELKRAVDGVLKCEIVAKKIKTECAKTVAKSTTATRRKKVIV